ncbi:Bacterial aa3 type cytochrome c oxidase subunit IV [Methylobrevis pamukkalensis]|uniref:Bacterial aa3 type cytochrome c oxidase subunit IV n=1 Tax=Methylobrevis pamukkalensis TaxID=1439726 RepID=A0A1E3GX87_9HYPH|nr:Bacterial aa3 type cytochrome c oxidase subunit IV [Methylobrevis pamukkalensis]
MAEHGSAMDYAEHEKTYNLFIGLVKWGSIHVIAILILMAIFLV